MHGNNQIIGMPWITGECQGAIGSAKECQCVPSIPICVRCQAVPSAKAFHCVPIYVRECKNILEKYSFLKYKRRRYIN